MTSSTLRLSASVEALIFVFCTVLLALNVEGDTLYDQTQDSVGFGFISTNWLQNDTLVQVADDFTVPTGEKWVLKSIVVQGFFSGNSPAGRNDTWSCIIYSVGNVSIGGLPGPDRPVFNFTGTVSLTSLAVEFTFPVPFVADQGGHYFVSVFPWLNTTVGQTPWNARLRNVSVPDVDCGPGYMCIDDYCAIPPSPSTGTTGSSGSSGSTGTFGTSRTTGSSGSSGTTGTVGSSGTSGTVASTGTTGSTTDHHATGSTGSTSNGTGATTESHGNSTSSSGSTSSGTTGSTGPSSHSTTGAPSTGLAPASTSASNTTDTTSHSVLSTGYNSTSTGSTSTGSTGSTGEPEVSTDSGSTGRRTTHADVGTTAIAEATTHQAEATSGTGVPPEASTTEHDVTSGGDHGTSDHHATSDSTSETSTGTSDATGATTSHATDATTAQSTDTATSSSGGHETTGTDAPTTGTTHATTNTDASTTGAPPATTRADSPTTGTTHDVSTDVPTTGATHASTGTDASTTDAPTTGTTHSSTSTDAPTTGTTHSSTSTDAPTTGTTHASTGTDASTSSSTHDSTSTGTEHASTDAGHVTDEPSTGTTHASDVSTTGTTGTDAPTTGAAHASTDGHASTDSVSTSGTTSTGTSEILRRKRDVAQTTGAVLFTTGGPVRCSGPNGLPAAVRDSSNTFVHVENGAPGSWVSMASIAALADVGTEEILFTLSGDLYRYDRSLPSLLAVVNNVSTVVDLKQPSPRVYMLVRLAASNGVFNATLTLQSPSAAQQLQISFNRSGAVLGTVEDGWTLGWFQGSALVPPASELGNWTLAAAVVVDATSVFVGGPNVRRYNATELRQLNLTATVTFVGTTLPTTAAAATTGLRATTAATSGAVQFQENVVMRLQGNVDSFNQAAFLTDISAKSNISQSRLLVTSVTSGSVVVAFSMLPGAGPSPSQAFALLTQAVQANPVIAGSPVLNLTSTASVYVPASTAAVPPVATTAASVVTTHQLVIVVPTSGAVASSTSSSSSSATSTAAAIVNDNSRSGELAQSTVIGIAVGVSVGALLVVLGVVLVVCLLRRKSRREAEEERGFDMVPMHSTPEPRPVPQPETSKPRTNTNPTRTSIYSAAPMPPPGRKAVLQQPAAPPSTETTMSTTMSTTVFYDGPSRVDRTASKNALYSDNAPEPNLYKVSPPDLAASPSAGKTPSRPFEIPFEQLYVDPPPVGRGFFGTVYRGTFRGSNIAVKQLLVEAGGLSPEEQEFLRQDAQRLVELSWHANIVPFFGVSKAPQDGSPLLITEWQDAGSLADLLRIQAQLPPVSKLVQSIAAGMHHLHSAGLLHRTLAARNVLLDAAGNVKLSDYGYSMTYGTYRKAEFNESVKWLAPEAMNFQFSEKSDVWSFGVVLWEIVTHQSPFAGEDPYSVAYAIANQGMFPPLPDWAPSILSKLMQHCFQFDPQHRPDFKTISYNVDICSPEDWLVPGAAV
eukprot:TRINITY_DN967_c0_g1_i2.p1 TRINITY_DN967_c0_g1~~TRINITY_DN967_c0_g1_i2.p1  ORF type:complete len:1468 (+),score=568.79 TRINITY_DN967_c0_g1_i2:106-4509(+)